MQVTFQLTPDDYRDGLLAWRNLRSWRRWGFRVLAIWMGLIFLVSVLQLFVAPAHFVSALPGIVFSVVALVFIWYGPSLSGRRQFRNTPSAHDPMTIEASDSGLHIHSIHADSKVSWSAYMAWGECKSVFIILPQPRIYVPIPKRALTPEQLGEFRELLGRNIEPRSK
jgi:YcxB-like protein